MVLVGLARYAQQDYSQRPVIRILSHPVKQATWLFNILLAALLCFSVAACKKKAGSAKTIGEAEVQLRVAIDSNPQARNIYLDKVMNAVQYERYPEALAGLDLLLKEPSLNEEQKKLTNQLIDMIKAKLGTPANP